MMANTVNTPQKGVLNSSPLLTRSLVMRDKQKISKYSMLWALINTCVLSVVLYDLSCQSTVYITYIQYIECGFAIILLLNTIIHFVRYFRSSFQWDSVKFETNQAVKTPTPVKTLDNSFNLITKLPSSVGTTPVRQYTGTSQVNTPNNNTPMNMSAFSWNSNFTPSDSYYKSSPWSQNVSYTSNSMDQSSNSPSRLYSNNISNLEPVTDTQSLDRYLEEYDAFQKTLNTDIQKEQSPNLLGSFWNYPTAQSNKDTSSFLKRCQYQLSIQSPTSSSPSSGSKVDDKNSPLNVYLQGMNLWKDINITSIILTQWNANLRLWISQTILERLVSEFKHIDDALQKHGLTDICVGSVGLDRLRKTAQMSPILQSIPSLSTLIPFLELSTNQEYLVKRIKELAKGGSMSDFKWNGGSSYDEKEWDYSLPTDSAIIMHLFATYLDTQLMPLPNKPDAKPFSSFHFIKSGDKAVSIDASTIAIQNVSDKPPHYRIVIGEEIHEIGKGYNNLFNCILYFLYQINKREHGMLGQVNLGRAGINMLWIIQI